MGKQYDVIIQNGTVIDRSQNLHSNLDVAIKDDQIIEVKKGISEDLAAKVITAEDKIVSPGFVDLHVHVFEGVSHYGVNPDKFCLKTGVTTVLDAGSSGADTFSGFRKYVIEVSETRIFAMLNISSLGMISPAIGELEDIRYADTEKATRVCEQNRDVIMGIKVRLSKKQVGGNGLLPLTKAKEVSDATGRPIMVHVGDTPGPLKDILAELRKGDILTHCFTGMPNGISGPDGTVISEAKDAIRRGVIFDIGHGQGSFSFEIARQAMDQGVQPNTISSDLHTYNVNGPVFDLATTASKFIHLGIPIEKVLEKITSIPASFLGEPTRIGTIRPGAFADITILSEESGSFVLEDSYGRKEIAKERIRPTLVMKGGQIVGR